MSEAECAQETRLLSIAQWHALARGGTALPMRIPLEGDSMRPLIRRGRDRVTIVPLERPLKLGDVALFHAPDGRYVVHRAYRLAPGRVRTLGDHCANPDPWMPESRVLGLAVQVERGGLRIALDNGASRAAGRIWMALLPARRSYFRVRSLAGRALRKMGWRR